MSVGGGLPEEKFDSSQSDSDQSDWDECDDWDFQPLNISDSIDRDPGPDASRSMKLDGFALSNVKWQTAGSHLQALERERSAYISDRLQYQLDEEASSRADGGNVEPITDKQTQEFGKSIEEHFVRKVLTFYLAQKRGALRSSLRTWIRGTTSFTQRV